MRNFLFHRVSPTRDQLWDPMDVQLFDKVLNYLSNNFEVVLFEEIINNKVSIHKNMATIMFDDGYKDNLEYAAPLLKKYNLKASFYVATHCIETRVPTWTYCLDYLTTNTNNSKIKLDFSFLDKKFQLLDLKDFSLLKQFKPFLKTLPFHEREIILEELNSKINDVEIPALMMDWGSVSQLTSEGHYVGSHSVNHFMLGTIEDEKIIENEIITSGKKIEKELGYFPVTFSYPIGSYNKTVMDICQRSGYRYGLAVNQIEFDPLHHGNYEIPRIELYNEPFWKSKLRMNGIISKVKNIINW